MELISPILSSQNPDGGWPYIRGSSWTEPTVYALLAQLAVQPDGASFERGLNWLRRQQRPDGGWAPQPAVAQSTWVTSLVALLPADKIGAVGHDAAVAWLLRQTGEESGWVYRLRQRLLGYSVGEELSHSGWPWFPGTAAWVTPTSLAVLALEKAVRRNRQPLLTERIAQGKEFLLARQCADGGWNHGSSRALGYDGNSYPETTGVALLALHGSRSPKLGKALAAAERHWRDCRSAEAAGWLFLGLQAHARQPQTVVAPSPYRGVRDSSLWILVQAAAQGRNFFLGDPA
ncbi:MAG TPA: prenyltransferase/squalene oxidase repeat-containing protein [Bryobacteraceae bacterium]|nr:prenyltransferase/squalene oxidase repeat-containing protein [Bryobacteraceae bacterium]